MDIFEPVTGPWGSGRRTSPKPTREPQRYRWFDQWLAARPGPLKSLVDATVDAVRHHEEHTGARKRARRKQDHEHHLQRIEAVVCNLAYAALLPPPGRIAVSLGHGNAGRSRYDSPVVGKLLGPTLNLLWEIDLLDVRSPTVRRGEASSIGISTWFAGKVAEHGISLADFARREDEEIIILSRTHRDLRGDDGSTHKELIDYEDSPETRRYRAELKDLNAFLASSEIDFLDDGLEPSIDPFDRTMRRRFTIRSNQKERFDQNGRLFGGFWQNLKSTRRKNIRISGEPTAVLDFSSMFTRLAYAHLGHDAPAGDLYAIPGFENYRSGIKFAMNCFLFDGRPRRSWPSELGIGVGDDKARDDGNDASSAARLPAGATVALVREAILAVHPVLRTAWDRRLGYRLMHQESFIIVDAIRKLGAKNIPALNLHDGLIVPASARETASRIMSSSARERSGAEIPVTEKT